MLLSRKKNVKETILSQNARDGLLSTAESDRTVPFSDVARWVSAARPEWWEVSGSCFAVNGGPLVPDTFSGVSKTGIICNRFN
jgi:hypothetical protein